MTFLSYSCILLQNMELLLATFFSTLCYCSGVYVFSGNPYSNGSLTTKHVVIPKNLDGSPEHMSAYFPVQSGNYAPLVFIGGLRGFLYSEMYSTVITELVTHGYIVLGLDLWYPATDDETSIQNDGSSEAQRIDKAIKWLQANLNQNVLVESDVSADWTCLGSFTHSAGADNIYKFMKLNSTALKAVAFLEPMSYAFTTPVNYSIPTVSLGTQLSEEFPDCIIPGYGYRHFYKMLKCPRIQMNMIGYGHCSILNEANWEVCNLTHVCKTNKKNDRTAYRTFVSGLLTSFFGNYLQGNTRLLQYITQVDKIPMTLGNFLTDVACDF